ncbi:MAG: MFS transporter [Rhodospirillales bacterium]|nr:MFS transporter [Rhodospirillales bacterium]
MTRYRFTARGGAVAIFLAIAFLDELMDGLVSSAWPHIRNDLSLSYVQIGMILSIPGLASVAIEPAIGIVGDMGHRRRLMITGGILYAISIALFALGQGFSVLLVAWLVFFPASGAFVSLAQASLMDFDLKRRAQNMARWNFSGSMGNFAGPLLLAAASAVAVGWRGAVLACALIATLALAPIMRLPARMFRPHPAHDAQSIGQAALSAIDALRRFEVVRWQVLLQASDLMLDLFKSFLTLYLVDVTGASEASAALLLAAWIGAGLLGDLILIPLLERVRPMGYLRVSVIAVLLVYPVFLLAPNLVFQLLMVGALGFATSGWYPILQARAYASLPERSGTVVALGNVFGLVAAVLPLGLAVAAANWGLGNSMWLLMIGPIAVGVGTAIRPARDPVA